MRRLLLVAGFLALGLPAVVWAQPVRARAEFQVNTYVTDNQDDPWVARSPSGRFVVAWESYGQDGSYDGIFAQRFDPTGAPVGGEFLVNTYTTSFQFDPRVAVDTSGGFVIVWESYLQDGSDYGTFARRYDSSGAPLASEFQVNTYTTSSQGDPAVGMSPSGGFVVVWESNGQDGYGRAVIGQRFDSTGARLGGEFQVNTYTTYSQDDPVVAMSASGQFVVAWESYGQDGSYDGVFARRFDSAGAPLRPEFQVNTYATSYQYDPRVAMDASGGFVVAWESDNDGYGYGISARRFDSSGAPLGPEFQVNSYTTYGQYDPSVAMNASGEFVVTWESYSQDGSYDGIFGRHFAPSGLPLGGEFQVNTTTLSDQRDPSVAVDFFGNPVVVWEDTSLDGSGRGVFSQRFTSPLRIAVTSPADLGTVDCSDPANVRPTITWTAGEYDRFRVFLASSPGFEKGTRVTSGDGLLKTTAYTPTAKKWRSACAKALAADPNTPVLHIRVFGLDPDTGKSDPERKYTSEPVRATVMP